MKGINKMDIEKIKSENITHEEHMKNVLQDEEYHMMGDYYRLNQVFINILKNSSKLILCL